jgi:hypothetical protein
VSASSGRATVTTSRNSAVTTSFTNRIALQTEEPCIELEWVVVMPSVVWQPCLFRGFDRPLSDGWRVWSEVVSQSTGLKWVVCWFLSEKLTTEMRILFCFNDWKLGRSKPFVLN